MFAFVNFRFAETICVQNSNGKTFCRLFKIEKSKKDYCICFTQVLFPLSAGPEYFVFWLRIAKLVFS